MKKHSLLPALMLILALSLSACSSRGSVSSAPGSAPYPSVNQDNGAAPSAMPPSMPSEPEGGLSGGESSYTDEKLPSLKESKLILRADLTMQSTEFDKALSSLDQLVREKGGYYESNIVQRGAYYDVNAARYGEFVIRVPQEQYHAFLSAAGTVGHIVNSSESSEDVGEVYYDTEIRLKTQQTKHERLLSLLEKATDMENIIALENALSEVEYQIERLSGTLRKYDSLVGYSTISLSLNEVLVITEQPREAVGIGGRIANAFSGGLKDMGRGLGNLAVWGAYNFFGILFFIALCAAAVLVVKRYRIRQEKRQRPESGDK